VPLFLTPLVPDPSLRPEDRPDCREPSGKVSHRRRLRLPIRSLNRRRQASPNPGSPGPRKPRIFDRTGRRLPACPGAGRGTRFAGAQARLHFLRFFAAEASITFHENRYGHGAIHVTQYPVQVSGILHPLPDALLSPYLVGGGWCYSRTTYFGSLSGLSKRTDHNSGARGGAGLEIRLGKSISLDGDIRCLSLNPSSSRVKNGDFNYWQVTFGLHLLF